MRQPSPHLAQGHHDNVDGEAHDDVPDQERGGAELERVDGAENQAGPDGPGNGHHVELSWLHAAMQVVLDRLAHGLVAVVSIADRLGGWRRRRFLLILAIGRWRWVGGLFAEAVSDLRKEAHRDDVGVADGCLGVGSPGETVERRKSEEETETGAREEEEEVCECCPFVTRAEGQM